MSDVPKDRGGPFRSVIRWIFDPGLLRSVGFDPVNGPLFAALTLTESNRSHIGTSWFAPAPPRARLRWAGFDRPPANSVSRFITSGGNAGSAVATNAPIGTVSRRGSSPAGSRGSRTAPSPASGSSAGRDGGSQAASGPSNTAFRSRGSGSSANHARPGRAKLGRCGRTDQSRPCASSSCGPHRQGAPTPRRGTVEQPLPYRLRKPFCQASHAGRYSSDRAGERWHPGHGPGGAAMVNSSGGMAIRRYGRRAARCTP